MLVMCYHSIMIQKNVLNDLGDTILKFSNFNFKLDIFINPIYFLNLFLMCRNEIIDSVKTPLKYRGGFRGGAHPARAPPPRPPPKIGKKYDFLA